jgi:hypothetical protein
MSAAKLLDRLRAKQAEKLAAREYSETPPIPPADGLQRRGAFIMPTRETMPAYRAHFDAKASYQTDSLTGASTPQTESAGSLAESASEKTERIRRLAATVTAAELLAAHRTIKPSLRKDLSAIDLHELALTLACADKREKSLASDETRPARVFYPRDVYQPEKAKESY